jgi:hypothetical protein
MIDDLKTSEELKTELLTAIEIIALGAIEIQSLRNQLFIKTARLEVFDTMVSIFRANAGSGLMSSGAGHPDPLYDMQQIINKYKKPNG